MCPSTPEDSCLINACGSVRAEWYPLNWVGTEGALHVLYCSSGVMAAPLELCDVASAYRIGPDYLCLGCVVHSVLYTNADHAAWPCLLPCAPVHQ